MHYRMCVAEYGVHDVYSCAVFVELGYKVLCYGRRLFDAMRGNLQTECKRFFDFARILFWFLLVF